MRKQIIAFTITFLLFLSTATVFATANPSITIVNPVSGATIYSDNLLVSVKMTTPSAIKVSVTQEVKTVNGNHTSITLEEYQTLEKTQISSIAVGTADNFTSTNNLSFYTKKVDGIKPGVYKITVETIDADSNVIHTNASPVEIKAKEENPANATTLESQNSGPAQFLKNILRAIFKD